MKSAKSQQRQSEKRKLFPLIKILRSWLEGMAVQIESKFYRLFWSLMDDDGSH